MDSQKLDLVLTFEKQEIHLHLDAWEIKDIVRACREAVAKRLRQIQETADEIGCKP